MSCWATEPNMPDQAFEEYQADLLQSLQDLVAFARSTTPEDDPTSSWWQRFLRWCRAW